MPGRVVATCTTSRDTLAPAAARSKVMPAAKTKRRRLLRLTRIETSFVCLRAAKIQRKEPRLGKREVLDREFDDRPFSFIRRSMKFDFFFFFFFCRSRIHRIRSRIGRFLLVDRNKAVVFENDVFVCYCGYSQCTVVLTRLRVIGRGNVGVITSRFERACRLSGGIARFARSPL